MSSSLSLNVDHCIHIENILVMRWSTIALLVILLCGHVLSSDYQSQSKAPVIPDGSQEPMRILPRVTRRTINCYQGPICQRFIDCLRFARTIGCR